MARYIMGVDPFIDYDNKVLPVIAKKHTIGKHYIAKYIAGELTVSFLHLDEMLKYYKCNTLIEEHTYDNIVQL